MPETIERWFLANYDKGMRFDKNPYQTPFFHTFPSWPHHIINKIPLHFQCIEVKLEKQKFRILKQLIIEIEAELIATPQLNS